MYHKRKRIEYILKNKSRLFGRRGLQKTLNWIHIKNSQIWWRVR